MTVEQTHAAVTVRYWAAARAAAGVDAQTLELAAPTTVGAVVDAAVAAHPRLERVARVATFLLDGRVRRARRDRRATERASRCCPPSPAGDAQWRPCLTTTPPPPARASPASPRVRAEPAGPAARGRPPPAAVVRWVGVGATLVAAVALLLPPRRGMPPCWLSPSCSPSSSPGAGHRWRSPTPLTPPRSCSPSRRVAIVLSAARDDLEWLAAAVAFGILLSFAAQLIRPPQREGLVLTLLASFGGLVVIASGTSAVVAANSHDRRGVSPPSGPQRSPRPSSPTCSRASSRGRAAMSGSSARRSRASRSWPASPVRWWLPPSSARSPPGQPRWSEPSSALVSWALRRVLVAGAGDGDRCGVRSGLRWPRCSSSAPSSTPPPPSSPDRRVAAPSLPPHRAEAAGTVEWPRRHAHGTEPPPRARATRIPVAATRHGGSRTVSVARGGRVRARLRAMARMRRRARPGPQRPKRSRGHSRCGAGEDRAATRGGGGQVSRRGPGLPAP